MTQQQILATRYCFFWGVLGLFIVKGLIFDVLIPLFQNPDEQTHFATIEYLAEPQEKTWPTYWRDNNIPNDAPIEAYAFSEDTIRAAYSVQFDQVRHQPENTPHFSSSQYGPNEPQILQNSWKNYIDTYPTNTSGTKSVYYSLGALLERWLDSQSIPFRFFVLRLLSLCFGIGVVFLTFATARKLDFSSFSATLIATLVAFQPMFSASAAQINIDIALIFAFSLFIYIGVVILNDGWHWKRALFLLFAVILGVLSKGPGIVLAVVACPLLFFSLYERFGKHHHFWKYTSSLVLGGIVLFAIVIPHSYLASITNANAPSHFSSPYTSLSRYLDKTLRLSEWKETRASYWGNFGWLDTKITNSVLDVISLIELAAVIGLIMLLCSKHPQPYLPQKRSLIFFLGLIIALELAIRFYDWRVFDAEGRIIIGTPGRYFLPTIISHILLLVAGLGAFTKNKIQFQIILKALALCMILLSLYALSDVIIPRYYL